MSNKHKTIVIKTDTLIDGTLNAPVKNAGVLIEGNKITRVAKWDDGGQWPQGDGVLHLETKALIPGLINNHVHVVGEDDLIENLRHGITSVRDVGTIPLDRLDISLRQMKNDINNGTREGPRIFSYGAIIDGKRTIYPELSTVVTCEEEARAEVDRQVQKGVDGIKLYFKLSPRLAQAIIDRAKEHNLPVAGHIGILIGGIQGARMGIDTIEHVVSFIRDLFPPVLYPIINLMEWRGKMDTPSAGLIDLFKMWRKFDPESKKMKKIAEDFKSTGSVFHPTLVAFERLTRIGDLVKERDPRYLEKLENKVTKELYEKTVPAKWNDKCKKIGQEGFDGMLRFVKLMHSTKVPIGAGTDDSIPFVYPGESLHDEMNYLNRAGINPLEVIQMATSRNAKTLRQEDLGIIASGKTADVVLLNRDPSNDILALREIGVVIKDGRIVYSCPSQ
jgi:imidazolonepropionase-like amidohydrolase